MAVPTTILQEHLSTAVGKLTVLRKIEDIGNQPSTKFYVVSAYRVDKKAAAIYWSSNTSGRVGSTLNLHMYAVMPLYNKTANISFIPKDTAAVKIDPLRYSPEYRQRYLLAHSPQAWLCIHLTDRMNNRSGVSDKTYRWKRFKEKSLDSLARATFTDITYFEQPANDLNRRAFLRTVQKIYPLDEKHPETLLLEARNIPFENRTGNHIAWAAGTFIFGISMFWFILSLTPIKSAQQILESQV